RGSVSRRTQTSLGADYAQPVSDHDPARLFLPRFVPQWVADFGPVAAIMLPPTAIIGHAAHQGHPQPARLLVYMLIATLPLVLRRRWPLEVLAWTIGIAIA